MLNIQRKTEDTLIEVLDNLGEIIQEDIMTVVTDRTHFLAYSPGEKMRVPIKVGDPINKADPVHMTIQENRIMQSIVPKEVYGQPFKVLSYPIQNAEGECIGAVSYAKSIDKEFSISNSLEKAEQVIATSYSDLKLVVDHVEKMTAALGIIRKLFKK